MMEASVPETDSTLSEKMITRSKETYYYKPTVKVLSGSQEQKMHAWQILMLLISS